MKRVMLSSILAGIMVAIGTIVYLNSQSMLGAFLFAIGLLTILHFKLDLFTGKVPYIKNGKDAAVAYGSYDFKFKNNL